MPFLLTLNSGQEAEARRYFSPASQPATPLAPQPAPVPVAPKCGTQEQNNWAVEVGKQIGQTMALNARFDTRERSFDSVMFKNLFVGRLRAAKPEWKECESGMTAIAERSAIMAFSNSIAQFQPIYSIR